MLTTQIPLTPNEPDYDCNDFEHDFLQLPDYLKTDLLQRLLKHTPDQTLQILSCAILPTLKRNFLALLPCELGYKILQHLDLRTVIRCTLVCKAWYHLINGKGGELSIWKKRLLLEFVDELELQDKLQEFQVEPKSNVYKALYQHEYLTRQNWFLGQAKQISFPAHGSHVVTCLSFDEDKIVSGSDDQTIHIYDLKKGELRTKLVGHDGGVWALQYLGSTLVSGSTDRSVRVWDMDTAECTHIFSGHTSTVRCLQIITPIKDKDGKMVPSEPLVVTGSRDTTLRVWRLPNPKTDAPWYPSHLQPNPFFKFLLNGHTNSVRAIAGQGNILISGSYDCTVRAWDIETGANLFIFNGHREKVYSVGYCHELQRAVSGSMDATVKVWCVATGDALFTLDGHNSLVGLLELTPRYLISAAADTTLRIWCPLTGRCLGQMTGHSAAITCFHVDEKSNRIISGSEGGVKVWELSSSGYGGASVDELTAVVPTSSRLGQSLGFSQGPDGLQPIYGRFIRDAVVDVTGVWRAKLDSNRLVCAVQGTDNRTRIEIFDFTESPEIGTFIQAPGDGSFRSDGEPEFDPDAMEETI